MDRLEVGAVLEHPCALCGGEMRLRESRFGLFYGCIRFSSCRGTHGAHPDGRPLGVPADEETKRWRGLAHAAFDRLWKGGLMKRSAAYRWMQVELGLAQDEAHIGRFDQSRCMTLIAAVERKLQRQRFG